MSNPVDSEMPGHVPQRLSNDALVSEYRARDFVATGTSLYSDAPTEGVAVDSPVPVEMLPRRATADEVLPSRNPARRETIRETHLRNSPRPAPDRSEPAHSEVVMGMLRLIGQDWNRDPNSVERALLKSAETMFFELANRAAELTKQTSMQIVKPKAAKPRKK